ncbi:MAG: AraC family transcriptional regulator [Clostridia bacterium]|nr:AraC family transcriptional regulator [Clostridia bacterium]
MYFYDFPIIKSEVNLPVYLFSVGLHEQQPHILRKEGYMYPQIIYCTKGSGTLVLDGRKHLIEPYTAFFLPAGYPHEYYPEEEVWDVHWVVPSGFGIEDMLRHFGLDAPAVFELGDIKNLEHHFRKMHDALVADRIFGNYRASGYLYDFLIEFYRLISTANSGGIVNSVVVRAVDYINVNYPSQITMEELCGVSGVSKQHLCRLFQSVLNSRPMEYIAKRRIQAAKELLSQTDMTVEEIAEEVGFCTGSYFCKLFRRYEGMTTSQFRKN